MTEEQTSCELKCDDLSDCQEENTGSTCINDDQISEVAASPVVESVSQEPILSKRKRKKLEQQLKKKTFLKEKRIQERERKKKRLAEAKAQGIDTGPSRRSLKHNTMTKSSCKIKTVIDCSFDELMTDKDIKSIVKQLNFCYASNRRAAQPLQFYVSSFNKRLKETMDAIGDYHRWDVNLDERSYEATFDKDEIVYLSSDSKNILSTLQEDKVYVIGGLVDHNHHKGVCLRLAEEKGLAHAQLPIGDYVTLESRNVLAINHVFEILLRHTENHDWKSAFYKVIPQRKIIARKHPVTDLKETVNSDQLESDQGANSMNDCDKGDGDLPEKMTKLEEIEKDNENCFEHVGQGNKEIFDDGIL